MAEAAPLDMVEWLSLVDSNPETARKNWENLDSARKKVWRDYDSPAISGALNKLGLMNVDTEGGRKRRKSRRNAKKTKKAMRKGKKSYSRRR